MLRRKISLGAKILQIDGIEKIFRRVFKKAKEGERLLKASQCYLWTMSGPIVGLIFISSEKVAFCSDNSIKFPSPAGELIRSHYKVSILLPKVSRAIQREDAKRRSDKYLQVLTTDQFDFWFLGFVGFKKTFKCFQGQVSAGSCGLKESVLATCLIDALGMSRDSPDVVRLINWHKGGVKTGINAGNLPNVAAKVTFLTDDMIASVIRNGIGFPSVDVAVLLVI